MDKKIYCKHGRTIQIPHLKPEMQLLHHLNQSKVGVKDISWQNIKAISL